jgi:hypothetical protein
VSNSRGEITIAPAGPYGIDAKNGKGDVEITLPPDVSATVDGRTHNGDIVSDFPLVINGDQSKTISGKIGGGSSRINLVADVGDLRIKRGEGFPPTPPSPPPVSAAPPAAPNAPHLKAPKSQTPVEPVTQ